MENYIEDMKEKKLLDKNNDNILLVDRVRSL